MCGKKKDVEHLLFKCSLTEFVWSFVSEALGWNGHPRSMSDMLMKWLPGGFG
jgi:hypothetical protein